MRTGAASIGAPVPSSAYFGPNPATVSDQYQPASRTNTGHSFGGVTSPSRGRTTAGVLRQRPDSLNQRLLREKLLQLREIAVPMLVDGLSRPHDDCFAEQAVRVIYASRINCSSALINLITSSDMEAYAMSLICMICGMTGSAEETLKPIWDRFHFFNKNYPEENFSQGPWLGLFELTHGHLDAEAAQ